jgi:Ca-activated chloride channel family protein
MIIKAKLIAILVFLLGLAHMAWAQGVIIPQCPPIPRPAPLPRALKVKSIRLSVKIDSQVATTRVEQVFENETPYLLEGFYVFPIPENASVFDFAMYDGSKRLAAEVIEGAKARQIYNDLVRRIIDPALLEYAGKNLIHARVFPVEPGGTRKIELAYTELLRSEGGAISYQYRLGSGRQLMPRPAEQISATVEITSPIGIKNIFSPSHKVSISRDGERRARLSFEGSGEEAQKDFSLYYSLSDKEFGLALLTHRDPGKDGYFLILISPKVNQDGRSRVAKDVVFVLDTSGSMSGAKLEKAKSALRFGIESLAPNDRFNIVSFSGEERLMTEGLVEASREAKRQGSEFIEGLRAEGGTNINDALAVAAGQLREPGRPAMIVLLTDGQPTVGITDAKQVARNVAEANRSKARIFCFGIGYDVNVELLDKLSAENRGASDYIEPDEDIEVKVSSFFAKVNYPVLSDLRLDLGTVQADMIYPRALPDLFRGSQLVIVGRYRGTAKGITIRLSGKSGSRDETFAFGGQDFPAENDANQFLPRLWAVRRVGYLLEQIRLNGESHELVEEIKSLGTRFGIITPYTSFLISGDVKPLPMAEQRWIRALTDAAPEATGEMAVARSKAMREMTEFIVERGAARYFAGIRVIGKKTFRLEGETWVDTEYDPNAEKVALKFGSDELLDLIAREPQLADYFSLGRKVIVVFKGKAYQVD